MNQSKFRTATTLILMSLGLFQLIAAALSIFSWMVVGDWRNMIFQIAGLAFCLTFPVTYWIWRKLVRGRDESK